MTNLSDIRQHLTSYQAINEKTLAAFCLLHGITKIHVYFDGSGDSGQIDAVHMDTAHGPFAHTDLTLPCWSRPPVSWNAQTRQWMHHEPVEHVVPVTQMVETLVYGYLDASGIDWYNNDGGFGHWIWTASDGQVNFEIYQRVIHEECALTQEYRLGETPELLDEEELP